MKNIRNLTTLTAANLAGTGWSLADAIDESISARIDAHRYGSLGARILARYDEVTPLMPSSDELKEMGVNVGLLAAVLDAGLDAELFGKVVNNGLDIEAFNVSLESGLDIALYNEGMAHLVEHNAEVAAFPTVTDRVLHRLGELQLA